MSCGTSSILVRAILTLYDARRNAHNIPVRRINDEYWEKKLMETGKLNYI